MEGTDNGGAYGNDEEVIGYFTTGKQINFSFIKFFHSLSPGLKEVHTVEKCKVVLAFFKSGETNTHISSALQDLSDTKHVLLVVLHNADPPSIPDSSRSVSSQNTLTVDWLISKDNEPLQCQKNSEAKSQVQQWIIQMIEEKKPDIQNLDPCLTVNTFKQPLKYLTITPGKTLKCHEDIKMNLQEQRPKLQEVITVEECDVILAFCHVVPQGGADIDVTMNLLAGLPESKPTVLVVLHHTSNPKNIDPDITRALTRGNMFKVDCLFHENERLLPCTQNETSLCKVTDWLIAEGLRSPEPTPVRKEEQKTERSHDPHWMPPNIVKIFSHVSGNTLGFHEKFVRMLCTRRPEVQEVLTVEECDVILCFCPVVSRAGTDIKAALKNLNDIPVTKDVVLVVLHHTLNPESIIPDSNRAVTRENTITVDCLFNEDSGFLPCSKNGDAFRTVLRLIEAKELRSPEPTPVRKEEQKTERSHDPHWMPPNLVKIFSHVSGNTLGFHEKFVRMLCTRRPEIQEVLTVEECDVILCFCPVVSRAGTDIEGALKNLNDIPVTKDVVLVVLHHTFNPESIVPDSNRAVTRENTITVDCLFHEDSGFLPCSKNGDAFRTVLTLIEAKADTKKNEDFLTGKLQNPFGNLKEKYCEAKSKASEGLGKILGKMTELGNKGSSSPWNKRVSPSLQRNKGSSSFFSPQMVERPDVSQVKLFSLVLGKTLGSHNDFVRMLCNRRPGLQEVFTVEECDVILGFCPVVSQARADITAALRKLDDVQGSKDVVLVVLHHTFDPETMVSDSSRSVTKKDTLAVDCLFHEDRGILRSSKNEEAFSTVSAWIEAQIKPKTNKGADNCLWKTTEHSNKESSSAKHLEDDNQLKKFKNDSSSPGQTLKEHGLRNTKYFCIISGDIQESHLQLLNILQEEIPDLRRMSSVEECDVILAFCAVDTSVAIERELQRVDATKPAVLVVIHEMTDQEGTIPDSSRSLTRTNAIRVNCLFHKEFGLLEFPFDRISDWLKAKGKEEEDVHIECEQTV